MTQALHIPSLKNAKINIFGEKYFQDMFAKAKTLILTNKGIKLVHVGLSILMNLAQLNPKTIINKVFNDDLLGYIKGT